MNSIIEQLANQQVWEEYLSYRLKKGRLNWHNFDKLDHIVEQKQYTPIVSSLIEGKQLNVPHKIVINKLGTSKKRIVYSFNEEEMIVLKVISCLLYRYDNFFAPNCYAFRRGLKASDGVIKIHKATRNRHLWAYKVDIHNYFNSISIPILLKQLSDLFADDPMLYQFFERMLTNDRVEYNNTIIHESHGAMAGVPTAPFLANVYLREMDHYFNTIGAIYARYSDDIIVFAESPETLQTYKAKIIEYLNKYQLKVNPSKERVYTPNEAYEFLGFKCYGNKIGISSVGVKKIKEKIRRKTRALHRWKSRKNIPEQYAMTYLIRYFNNKFFENGDENTLTWSRWYFPIINCTDELQEIDHYLQQSIRFLGTGKRSKSQYRISYDSIKDLGYKSLVHEYYSTHCKSAI